MQDTILIGVYGTLKKGGYNHYRMGDAEYMGKVTTKGVMYIHEMGYPLLFKDSLDEYSPFTERLSRHHEVEIYQIDIDAYECILDMELGAGYYEVILPTVEFGGIRAFLYPHEQYKASFFWVDKFSSYNV